ncbi:flagellin [Anaerosalibacter bizertensis]|uniref:Flagellin n=1 Tax=Anaerosalibacter bizertensis TaxID=932217 RepID=A0A9Q4AC66_9FIRM|nr:flagellin [Anaerosalibacter bizertensis]MBV1817984.1 flagellin [Bacteroidales bacterium MSK.15.36]MCB5559340.1 flagellin [Anaerosalibacter bizertensis]MCG4565213.1 flagellin [Anaerosalibacter bizertensis]MCG4581995.1 flagellin [Anaerosalibacter bizertensis]MCG4584308.1 flagellin [Anaerosalibacter bizertensis]
MRINNNIPALNTHRIFTGNTNAMQKSLERLSSGKRINRAADDAAGMAISQKMQAQVRGLRQASRNSLDGISLIQTAEGALNEIHAMLQRMRELSVQGANGTYTEDDLKAIGDEIVQLTEQIDQISNDTEFNGKKLLNGKEKVQLQVGANEEQTIEIDMNDINATISGLEINDFKKEIEDAIEAAEKDKKLSNEKIESGIFSLKESGLKRENFETAINIYQGAIDRVAGMRSKLGAYQNRLEHTMKNIDNTAENLTASMSRIEDADMALEMSEFTRLNILQQAGTAMLAQANQLPQGVLQLLR